MSLFANSQIDINELPKVETVDLKPIEPKYFIIILVNTLIAYIIPIIAIIIIRDFAEQDADIKNAFWYLISIICFFCFITILINYLGFKKRKYAMREKDITYSHGYLINNTITLPYNRIQHIEIARSFLARKLGLSTLKIYSAGQSGGDIAIKGLPKDIADAQYAFLIKLINERS
ncbi:membrane-flanked domain [Flavobacteriales bacterium ALC-1]|nr:membrane-flanked domain [Flavobacteriales bacterium ALC-1]